MRKHSHTKYFAALREIHARLTTGQTVSYPKLARRYRISAALRTTLTSLNLISPDGARWLGPEPSEETAYQALECLRRYNRAHAQPKRDRAEANDSEPVTDSRPAAERDPDPEPQLTLLPNDPALQQELKAIAQALADQHDLLVLILEGQQRAAQLLLDRRGIGAEPLKHH